MPPSSAVAHKTGDWRYGDYHHDCGIVYLPGRPYLICMMTGGLDRDSANRLISSVNRDVYAYVAALKEILVAK